MDVEFFKSRSRAFKAMGHPTRLMILCQLDLGPACVNDLQKVVGYDMSTVSKHLSVLRDAALVKDRRQGNQVFYSLACTCVMDFIQCMDETLGLRSAVLPTMEAGRGKEALAGKQPVT